VSTVTPINRSLLSQSNYVYDLKGCAWWLYCPGAIWSLLFCSPFSFLNYNFKRKPELTKKSFIFIFRTVNVFTNLIGKYVCIHSWTMSKNPSSLYHVHTTDSSLCNKLIILILFKNLIETELKMYLIMFVHAGTQDVY